MEVKTEAETKAGHISHPQIFSRLDGHDNCYVKSDGLDRVQYTTYRVSGVYRYRIEMSFYISQAHR
ncbi:MAG: hypothetical protein CMQ10_04955 [Gammaproteobacteria bacterium]|nr:hypothetical protein [Gammaproteobacteria bacterium]